MFNPIATFRINPAEMAAEKGVLPSELDGVKVRHRVEKLRKEWK